MSADKDYSLRVFLDEEGTPPYKGFIILRQRPHFLFEIKPRDGFELSPSLSGKFTKLELLHQAIDQHLAEHSSSPEAAYVKVLTSRPRGRPRKDFIADEYSRSHIYDRV